MTKGYKNPNDYVFLRIDATPYLWENAGCLYFWDVDKTCYMWSGEQTYWVASTMFDYNLYFYLGIAPEREVTGEEAKLRFPGSLPIEVLTNKKASNRRTRLIRENKIAYREQKIANTDLHVFQDPESLPRGFGFLDTGKRRVYSHKHNRREHAIGMVMFLTRQEYSGEVWAPGLDHKTSFSTHSISLVSENEAQKWVLENLRKLEKAERASAKALKTQKEGEKNA